ncbi:MAG: lipase family protein [Clostridium sp.]
MNTLEAIKLCIRVEYINNDTSPLEYFKDVETDAEMCLLQKPTYNVIIFKSTDSKRDWEINKMFLPTRDADGDIYHSGFYKQYRTLHDKVIEWADKNKHLYLIGHSLGGALAEICSIHLFKDYPNVSVKTFGAPRAVISSSKVHVDSESYFLENDIVAMVPPPPYRHLSYSKIVLSKTGESKAGKFRNYNTTLFQKFLYYLNRVNYIRLLIAYFKKKNDDNHSSQNYKKAIEKLKFLKIRL